MKRKNSLGVVIGRFQVPKLHDGHRHTVDVAACNHEQLVILVGHNDVRLMPRNEMSVGMRVVMMQQAYPNALVLPLPDSKVSNKDWSKNLDLLLDGIRAGGDAVLYGSRDSFIPFYNGRFETTEVTQLSSVSGTAIRAEMTPESIKTAEGRRGWIAAIRSQYPIIDSVVDIAVVSADWKQVLLGRRGEDASLRFFGGFLDATDVSDAVAARREQTEEVVDIEVSDPTYIGSARVDDPRYRGNGKGWGVMTRFHVSIFQAGNPSGSDDIALVQWVDLQPETKGSLVAPHHELFDMLLEKQQLVLQTAA